MTYPSGRVLNLGHDSKGRLTSVGSFVTNMTYNAIGQMTGNTLGNGVIEGYSYSANRMQLISQTATKNGGPANGLMNLNYHYQAAAGQMGAGSTAGNAGQLTAINNNSTIGGIPESAAYTYDNLKRLVTSNQSSNGSTAQRRFAYDRWGNRTGMWNAVTGGSQIQGVTLEQSNGAPTNRIASVSSGKTSTDYQYDAAGNVTNDGAHTYTYDAENRITSVDGGATGQYSYDVLNQRYKKVTPGATTHYIWEKSQVIAEHNGNNGAVLIDYVYAGSRMIAKVESGATQYLLSDRLSIRLVLNATGNVVGRQSHLPFGETFGEAGAQEKHYFTSYERDGEDGFDYALNRFYSSTTGRFVSLDPIMDQGFKAKGVRGCSTWTVTTQHTYQPQELDRYAYVVNEPINNIDPYGLETWRDCMSREMRECSDKYVSGEKVSAWKTIIVGLGCILSCVAMETGIGAAACALCIVGLLGDGLRDDEKGKYQGCLEDRRFRCRGLRGEPGGYDETSGLGGGFELGDFSDMCFGFTCDPFRTGEWEPALIEL